MIATIGRPPGIPAVVRPGIATVRMPPKTIGVDDVEDAVKAKASAAPAAGETVEKSGFLGNALDKANTVVSAGSMLALPAFIGLPVAGWLGRHAGNGLGKIGEWTKLDFLKRAGTRMADGITGFNKSANETTFAQLGEKMRINKPAGRASQYIADKMGNAAQRASDYTGFGEFAASRRAGRAHANLLRAKDAAGKIDLAAAHVDLHDPLKGIKGMLQGAHTAEHLNAEEFGKALEGINKALKNEAVRKESRGILGDLGRIEKFAGRAMTHHEGAKGIRNIGAGIRNTPKAIGQTSALHGVVNGAFIAGSGLSMLNDGRGFLGKLRTLQQMYADITGKQASKFRVMFGDVPAPVADARKNMLKLIGISEVSDAASIGINIAGARSHNNWGFIKGGLIYMLPDWISKGAEGMLGNQIASVYEAMRQSHQAKQLLSADDYAMLLSVASADLRNRGAGSSFTKAVAEQYAAAQMSPGEVLKEITNGTMMQRVAKLIVASENGQAHTVTDAKKRERTVVGKHTQKLAQSAPPALEQGV